MELDWPSRSPGSGPWVLSRAENIFGIYFGQSPIKRYTVQENVFGSLFGYEVDFQELFNRKSQIGNGKSYISSAINSSCNPGQSKNTRKDGLCGQG